jgi:2-alkyl-3-oxoalkanoate reductase
MRVLVAGAAGAIGRRLVPQLVARGHQVTGTTRANRKLEDLRSRGAEAVLMDGLDEGAVSDVVAQAQPDAIVHQMTALAGNPDLRRFDRWFATTNELRIRGTDNLLAAAAAAHVPRFIAQSYTGWTNAAEGETVKTERDDVEQHPPKAQRESLAAIRYVEERVTAADLDGIVLRYGNFYGPAASEALVRMIRTRRFPLVGDGAGVWSWIHVDDAAAATIAAVERGGRGVYNIVDDDPAPASEWLPYLAEAVGAKPPRTVPAWLARMLAGSVAVRWMTEARGSSNAAAKRELDWQPAWASWRDGFRDGLEDDVGVPRLTPQKAQIARLGPDGPHRPRDRRAAVHQRPHGRVSPAQGLHQDGDQSRRELRGALPDDQSVFSSR